MGVVKTGMDIGVQCIEVFTISSHKTDSLESQVTAIMEDMKACVTKEMKSQHIRYMLEHGTQLQVGIDDPIKSINKYFVTIANVLEIKCQGGCEGPS